MRRAVVVVLTLAVLILGAQALVANIGVFASTTAVAAPINAPDLQATASAASSAAALPNTGVDTAASFPILALGAVVLVSLGLGILALATVRRNARL